MALVLLHKELLRCSVQQILEDHARKARQKNLDARRGAQLRDGERERLERVRGVIDGTGASG